MRTHLRLEFTISQGDFTLELCERVEAQVLALFGPSGSGKTTTLETIAGLRRPSSGVIEIGGRLLYSSADGVDIPPRRRGIGYVPQEAVLFPHMDVRGNVLYGSGRGNGVALAKVLEILEIEDLIGRDVASLSGGERQRVALARALMSSPSLLLLDEPLAAVDRSLRRRIVPCLDRIRVELQVPMIYVSHDAGELREMADHVVVLDRGRVATSGDPASALEG